MKPTLAAALAAAVLIAACDRPTQPRTQPSATDSSTSSQPLPQTGGAGSSTAAPSAEQKKEGANPQQGQVDPKDTAQRRDFQHKGDGAGPTSPEAEPK